MNRRTNKILHAAPVTWRESAEAMSDNDRGEMIGELESLMQRAALLSAYLVGKQHSEDHETAVARAQKRFVKARKAIGFTYPESGVFSF